MRSPLVRVLPAVLFAACGGGGGGSPASNTPPVTQPACVQNVVFQHSGPVPAETLVYAPFSTSTLGRLDATVDWTFAATPLAVYIVDAVACPFERLGSADQRCLALAGAETGLKPRRISHFSAAPGSYALVLINVGSVDDAAAAQVVLSSSSCPAITAVGAELKRLPLAGVRYLREE